MAARKPTPQPRKRTATPTRKATPRRTSPKVIPEQDSIILNPEQVEGIWQEFEETFEHLSNEKAIIVITLDRKTGFVEIDETMSTPMETYGALVTAYAQVNGAVDRVNGLDLGE